MTIELTITKLKASSIRSFAPETKAVIDNRIESAVKSQRRIRSDAIRALKLKVHTQNLSDLQLDQVSVALKDWCADYFHAAKNIIEFFTKPSLIAAIICPITNDARLCAKEFYGSSPLKYKIQKSLLDKLKPLGITQVKLITPTKKKSLSNRQEPEQEIKPESKTDADLVYFKTNLADLNAAYRHLKKERGALRKEVENLKLENQQLIKQIADLTKE